MNSKIIFKTAVAVLFVAAQFSYAQNGVDSNELRSNLGTVEFIDNTAAPDPALFNTRAQIFGIGSGLGNAVRGGAANAGARNRYFVIHRLHPAEFDKLDADIFGLGSGSNVDTIRNLRSIVQGYLQSAYSYSAADATLLAEYITIYNAVYRKNRTYFSTRYKTPLMTDLTPGLEGIGLRWNEWAGQTLMLVPLQTAADGSLSAIDTTVITEDAVISELKKEEGGNAIDQRQQMVDLKDRESDQAAERAERLRAEAAAEEKRIAAEKTQLDAEKARVAAEQAALANNNSAEAQQRKDDLEVEAEALAAQEKALDEREAAVDEKNAAAESAEALAARKAEEAAAERDAISNDQRAEIAAAPPPANSTPAIQGLLAINLSSKSAAAGSPVHVDPSSADVIKTSSLSAVKARTLSMLGSKFYAIAGESGEKSVQHLIEIDATELRMLQRGSDEISPNSLLWVNGNSIYAIIVKGGKNYLGRFGGDLKIQAQSKTAVHSMASVNLSAGKLITQDEKGDVILLNADSLAE